MSQYLELARRVAAQAAEGGAEAEVIITRDKQTSLRVSAGEIEQLSQSGSSGMGVRVIKNGQMGYAHTADLSDESVTATWRAAVELAEVSTADEYRRLPEPQPVPDEDLQIWDPDLADVPMTDKIEKLRQAEAAALASSPRVFATNFCLYADRSGTTHMATSKGFAGEYGKTIAYIVLSPVARDKSGMTNAFAMDVQTRFADLDAAALGKRAGLKVASMLGGKPVPTQQGTVIFDHIVGAQIIAAIAQALTASAMQRQRSFLLDRMGQTVANDRVTLLDNGRLPGGIGTVPFDGEGVPTSATRLVDEGVLQAVIYDSYSAARDGVPSTGNAQRDGHTSLPTLGPSNFYLQPGHKSRAEIIAGVEKGLYVLSAMQTGGIDPITGDCSMGVNGLWIENGDIVGPVSGVTVATTLQDLLMNITEVGDDLRMMPMFGNIGVPTIRVDNVTIGGS